MILPVILPVILVTAVAVASGFPDDEAISGGQPPYLSSKKSWDSRVIEQGQSTTLKCPVQSDGGQPVYFRWFKEKEELSEVFFDYKLSGAENKRLTIRRLSSETEGRYRCRGINGFGSQEFTFIIQLKGTANKSLQNVLVPGVLLNQTVLKGSPLKLNCRVSSMEMFPVKWLKKVDMDKITEAEPQLSYLQIGVDKYKVFKISESSRFLLSEKFSLEDGSFQHSLSFISAEVNDSGQYACMVFGQDSLNLSPLANQTAHIKVISPTHPSPLLSFSPASPGSSPTVSSLTIVLAVLGSVVLLLLLVLAGLLLKPARKKVLNANEPVLVTEMNLNNATMETKFGNQTDLGHFSDAHDKLINTVDGKTETRRDPHVSWVWTGQAGKEQRQNTLRHDTLGQGTLVPNNLGHDTRTPNTLGHGNLARNTIAREITKGNTFIEFV